jgi:hypothetical protein
LAFPFRNGLRIFNPDIMRLYLLALFIFGISICASAQRWSIAARTGAQLADGRAAMIFLRGSGPITELGVYRGIKKSRLEIGLTVGHFQTGGLTRFAHALEFAGCLVGSAFPTVPPSPAERPIFSSRYVPRENFWSALPALRYTWLDRKVYGQFSVAAGGIYQPGFTRTLSDSRAAPDEVTEVEISQRSATLSASVRGEFTVGLRLGERFGFGAYVGYDRTQLRVARTSQNISNGTGLTIDGTLPLHQVRAGLTAEIAL